MAPAEEAPEPEAPDPRAEAMVDPVFREATVALRQRRPWRTETLIRPLLADSTLRTEWVVILAAEAAGATDRWERVDSLLSEMPFENPYAVSDARLLLARSALERGDARGALVHASVARDLAESPAMRAPALVFIARAHERLGARDSARAAYNAAAVVLRPVGDWLTLRATSLTRDSALRNEQYERLRTPVARQHALYSEAQMLERSGRARAAIGLYERAGRPFNAMRLRAATASGAADRAVARRELIEFVEANSGTDEARVAIEILDGGRFRLTANEEIVVAHSAVKHGPLSRARVALERAFAVRAPTGPERFFQISVLAESGPSSRREATRLLSLIRKPSPYAGEAALERAKLLRRRGQSSAARTALRNVVRLYPLDTVAAPGALIALAEMAIDEKRDPAAREAYLTLARKYPTSEYAAHARFEAAILAIAARRNRIASAELDTLLTLYPTTEDTSAARYWSAKTLAMLRDSATAEERWAMTFESAPMSYYSAQSARRLGIKPWAPEEAPDTFVAFPDVKAAFARADMLERLGMAYEARLELDALAESADSSVEHILAIGNGFRERALMRRTMDIGRRAIAAGANDARAWRLVYPVGEADLVAMESAAKKVDPALVAALIRQESKFEARATSPVGARGMMQMMPAVGKALARSERIRPWDVEMLYDPSVNIRLGVVHLKSFIRHYGSPELALAAYNAGPGRVARWSSRTGGKDPEVFVERIRFAETKHYVRNVLRSRDMYAALYDWARIGATN
jgi:soluble lytic murein transglycosylase